MITQNPYGFALPSDCTASFAEALERSFGDPPSPRRLELDVDLVLWTDLRMSLAGGSRQ